MAKIALLVPYFGKLPAYTSVFFETLRRNPDLELLLITDQVVDNAPQNVIVRRMSFAALRKHIQSKFDFPICLERPYKLCDYRPAYGYIFDEMLQDYTFWGHCDLDMVLGDVCRFLPDDVLNTYDKIYQLGHLCLYRNTPENNRRFMLSGGMDYRQVFTTPINCIFDEIIGMQKKFTLLGIPTYTAKDCADISPWHHSFRRAESHLTKEEKLHFNYRKQVFFWEDGHIYRAAEVDGQILYDEFNYLHFQKRDLRFSAPIAEFPLSFYCTPDGFVEKEPGFHVTLEDIDKFNGAHPRDELFARTRYHSFIFKRRFNKYILKK